MKVLFLWGPPAVGKMAIGNEIARLTGYKTLYAHNMLENHSRLFFWIYGRFLKVELDLYLEILDELLASDIPGIVITKVRYLNQKRDNQMVEMILEKIREKRAPILEVELYADLTTRLERYIASKRRKQRSSRLLKMASDRRIRDMVNVKGKINSEHPFGEINGRYIKIDTSTLKISEVTSKIVDFYELPLNAK